MEEVHSAFRPEFVNRLDDIMLFECLQAAQMGAIVDIQMERLKALLAGRGLEIELSDAARSWLAEKGYDPVYGARPLKRVIQREVQDGLAEEILSGALGEDAYVLVDITGDQISLTASEKKAALN